jgi:hypothetical protein
VSIVANRVAGTTYVYVDGALLPLGGTITVSTWDADKETVVGLSKVMRYKEKPRAPFIEVKVITDGTLDLQAFQGVRNSTITAELANGQVGVLNPAWATSAPDGNHADGTATLRFEGRKCERTV